MVEEKIIEEKKRMKILGVDNICGWGLLAVFYACDVAFMWIKGRKIIDSDASSEMLLASLLNKEGRFITTSWYYSTELRIVNNQPIYQLALKLFPDNWHTARVFAVALLLIILIVSILVFSKCIGHFQSGLYVACAVICPICPYYASHIPFKSHYIPYLLVTMITLACVSAASVAEGLFRRSTLCMLAAMLACASCLNGIRMLMVCYVPLFAAAVVLLCLFREDRRYWRVFVMSCIFLVAGGMGFLVNSRVLSKVFSFANYSVSTLKGFTAHGLFITIQNLVTLYGGWREYADIRVMSLFGVAYYWGLLIFLAVLCSLVFFARHIKELSFGEALLTAFSVMLFFCLLLTLSQIDPTEGAKPYWIPFVPFSFFFPVLYLERIGKKFVRTAFTASFLMCALYTAKYPYVKQFPAGERLINVAQWLTDNGVIRGAATFWNSNVLTELSDGKIEMWTVQNSSLPELDAYEWLQECRHTDLPEMPFFLLIDQSDKNVGQFTEERWSEYVVYEEGPFIIFLFDSIDEYTAVLQ